MAKSIECPDGHTFDNRIKGYTVAYHRDRGEEFTINEFKSLEDARYNINYEAYNYVWDNGRWTWSCDNPFKYDENKRLILNFENTEK